MRRCQKIHARSAALKKHRICPESKALLSKRPNVRLKVKMLCNIIAPECILQRIIVRPVQHEAELLEARNKEVDIRKHAPQNTLPICAAGLTVRIHGRKVEACRDPGTLHRTKQPFKLRAVICVHPLHECRISEMKERCAAKRICGLCCSSGNCRPTRWNLIERL